VKSIRLPSWTERLLGSASVAAPPDVFALDGRELRYARLDPGPQGYVLEGYRWQELPPESFQDGTLGGTLRSPGDFQALLGEFISRSSEPIKQASLVLPDDWLRLTFAEITELPRKVREVEDVLRWKLKRLVPFNVDELRVSATEVSPVPGQDEPRRLLLGIGLENQLAQIEASFAAAGVQIGTITNTTLALLSSLEEAVERQDLAALISTDGETYTLSYFHAGEPLIYRFKAFTKAMSAEVRELSVARDLRLTGRFVRDRFSELSLQRVFLAAAAEVEEDWRRLIQTELGLPAEPLNLDLFPLVGAQVGASWLETAPLLGAARLEVA